MSVLIRTRCPGWSVLRWIVQVPCTVPVRAKGLFPPGEGSVFPLQFYRVFCALKIEVLQGCHLLARKLTFLPCAEEGAYSAKEAA